MNHEFGYPTDQESKDAAKDIMKEQVLKLAHVQMALIGSIHFLSSIIGRTERQQEELDKRSKKLIAITDNLGELNIELKAFNSLPQ